MNRLLSKFKNCDGLICEQIAEWAFVAVIVTIIVQSIAQISA